MLTLLDALLLLVTTVDFLDRIATHILAFENDGSVNWNEGNYEDYINFRKTHLNKKDEEDSHKRQPRLTR